MSPWIEPREFFAGLAAFHASAGALITEPQTGRVLLVKPHYRDTWTWPGGYLDPGEPPHDGCAREVAEELGLTVTPGRLLLVEFVPPAAERRRGLLCMTFDCGELPPAAEIHLQEDELQEWAFLTPAEAATRVRPQERDRVSAALNARTHNTTHYLPVTL